MITIKIEHKEDMDIKMTAGEWKRWRQGMHIQNAMKNLNNDQREFLISGIAPKEWDRLFGGKDEG